MTVQAYLAARGVELSTTTSESRQFGTWALWGLVDSLCASCSDSQILIADAKSLQYPGNVGVLCLTCQRVTVSFNLSMRDQQLIQDRFQRACEFDFESIARSVSIFLKSLSGLLFSLPKLNVNERPTIENRIPAQFGVPIPPGYRSVAWVRKYEAGAIVDAYLAKSTVTIRDDKGNLRFEAKYFNPGDPQVEKFHANVKATRYRVAEPRVIGWIRNEEATAILNAHNEERDIGFDHESQGLGGLAQYFEPESEAARQFLSCTRLLRRV